LDRLGGALDATAASITWAANAEPPRGPIWVYRVVPRHFDASTVSNLVAIGEFSDPGHVLAMMAGAMRAKECHYQEPKGSCINNFVIAGVNLTIS